jgi:hypothetical protein
MSSRRCFLQQTAAAGAAAALGEFAALAHLAPARAEEAHVAQELIRFGPDIEPVVRLIEETPREKCIEVVLDQLRGGLSYRHFLAALYLAAIRAARWHGSIHGYDHSAYLVHSVHQLTLDLPYAERLLPTFFALEGFKGGQEAYPNRPVMTKLSGALPSAERAADELHAAMRQWEPDRAERAIVAMLRSQGTSAVLEPLWHYAGRDWGFIGHMAILVASSSRLLETIGWQHAEHVLRYVVAALAGWGKEHAETPDVQPYWGNLPRVERTIGRLPADWAEGKGNEGLTKDLLDLVRRGKPDEACDLAVTWLGDGKAQAGAIWDAIHLAAGELVLSSKPHNDRRPINSNALHANTAANALHYAFRASTRTDTRLLLSLQGLAWMHLFRQGIVESNHLAEAVDITAPARIEPGGSPKEAIDAIMAARTARPREASGLAFAFAERYPMGPLLDAARPLLASKSSGDPHDIKFPVAIFEDLSHVSEAWRPHLLAAAAFSFWGSERPDLPFVEKVRGAL